MILRNQTVRKPEATGDREEVFRTLNDIYLRSRDLLLRRKVRLENAVTLSDGITHLRRLLQELEQLESGLKKSGRTNSLIIDLKERFLELEGMIKETRNDLAGKNG